MAKGAANNGVNGNYGNQNGLLCRNGEIGEDDHKNENGEDEDTEEDNVLGVTMTFSSAGYLAFVPTMLTDLDGMMVKITADNGTSIWEMKNAKSEIFAVVDDTKSEGEKKYIIEINSFFIRFFRHNICIL
jgi:hypothetical protein